MSESNVRQCVVIGGGLNGLATLYHLHVLGCRNLTLLEQFRLGHERGSSHGQSRITRSTYPRADYVRLTQYAHAEEWPRLERDAQMQLIHPTTGCFFGAGESFEQYARAVSEVGAAVERIDVAEARRRFPQFRLEGAAGALHDHTAGVVAAANTMEALARLAHQHDVEIREETRVLDLDLSTDPITIRTERDTIAAERVVITAGSWAGRLLPRLASTLRPARQTVGYFRSKSSAADYQLGRFPVWIHIADGPNNIHYGLPEFGRPGAKLARHCTADRNDDPDVVLDQIETAHLEEMQQFLDEQFTAGDFECVGAEHCLYTNTPTEDFILDLHPDNPRVAIGAGFSGHGFKFGPLTGRILAELVLNGQTAIAPFEAMRPIFSIPRSV